METTDLRTEFTKETKTRFNSEWIAYNDYASWMEHRLIKLLTIPLVIKSLPEPDEIRMKARELDEKDFAQWMYEIQKGNVL